MYLHACCQAIFEPFALPSSLLFHIIFSLQFLYTIFVYYTQHVNDECAYDLWMDRSFVRSFVCFTQIFVFVFLSLCTHGDVTCVHHKIINFLSWQPHTSRVCVLCFFKREIFLCCVVIVFCACRASVIVCCVCFLCVLYECILQHIYIRMCVAEEKINFSL